MTKNKMKSLSMWLVIGALAVVATGGIAYAVGSAVNNIENAGVVYYGNPTQVENLGEAMFGSSGTRFPNGISADSTSPVAGQVRGTTLTITGDASISGGLNSLEALTSVATVNIVTTPSTTITAAQSGETFVFTTTTEFVLPATSTAAIGANYKFVAGSGITASTTIRGNTLVNGIEGSMIVAGAVVDCDAENFITFGADGENVGDFVELFTDGTHWLIRNSNALSAPYLTCSTS